MGGKVSTGKEGRKAFWLRPAPITIVGAVLLGVIGSTIYDLIVKPGLSTFGRFILNLLTLGSKNLQDAAYSSAALDPTPISSLLILYAILGLATFPAVRVLTRERKDDPRDFERQLEHLSDEDRQLLIETTLTSLRRKVTRIKVAFFAIFTPWWLGLCIALMVHNQSVAIWRAFHVNVAILTPGITPAERSQLVADFSSMKGRDDFQSIRKRMGGLASRSGIKLKDIETW